MQSTINMLYIMLGGLGPLRKFLKISKLLSTNGSAVPSVCDPEEHNSHAGYARSDVRISFAPHAVLLRPLRDHTGHEMHPRGFTALEKIT